MNNLQFEHVIDEEYINLEAVLPDSLQRWAARQFRILQENPLYPSLHFKKVSVGLWSIRITDDYRALGYERDGLIIWYWIGPHSEYEKMIKKPNR